MTEEEYVAQEAQVYKNCITATGDKPENALEMALTWRDTGGGLPARHCVAMAYSAMGDYQSAGLEFETLADEMRRGLGWSFLGIAPPAKRGLLAEVYAQGGNAWLLAGDPNKAYELFTRGLSETEEKTGTYANLLIDRSLASGQMGDYQKALDDLQKVETFIKPDAEIHVLKASAYRGLKQYIQAKIELETAFRLDNQNREAFLERGNLLHEMGDDEGAKENWQAYLRVYPDGPAAKAVRENLEALDEGPEG